MRLIWSERVNDNAHYSIETEVIVDDEGSAAEAGVDAVRFLKEFQDGVIRAAGDLS